MILQAQSPHCFSSRYVLRLDGRLYGQFKGRWFSEAMDVTLRNRRRLVLRKISWWRGSLELLDRRAGQSLGGAERAGWLSRTWSLALVSGPATMSSAGWFNSGYQVERDGLLIAQVARIGYCTTGWRVRAEVSMVEPTDLLLIGLVYQTILNRRQRSSAGAAGAAAGAGAGAG